MKRIDQFVYAPDKRPYYGWDNDQFEGKTPTTGWLVSPHSKHKEYLGVIQQDRTEYQEFVRHVLNRGLGETAIQIGLGMRGGSHFALRQMFRRVITIDWDPGTIERFLGYYNLVANADYLIQADARHPDTIKQVQSIEPTADLLFIDGGHKLDEVRADWENYRGLVRPGGMICFHDHADRSHPEIEVHRFIEWLRPQIGELFEIGTRLGIAYYIAKA